jgi:hypothetical protein
MTQAANLAALGTNTSSTGVAGVAGGGTGLTAPGTAGNVLTSNGTAWTSATPTSVNTSQLAKAWVSWAGASGTINSSYNVTSVTRNSTGNYTVTFTTAFANTNYAIVFGGNRNNTATDTFGMLFYNQAAGSVNVITSVPTSTYVDATTACIACFA